MPSLLSPRQRRILEDLEDAYGALKKHHGRSVDETEVDEIFAAVLVDYDRAVMAAVRAGLVRHPLVSAWLTVNRGLGQRRLLRKAQKGLETGVRRPWSLADVWLASEATKLAEKGRQPEAIRRRLIAKLRRLAAEGGNRFIGGKSEADDLANRLQRMSRQGWHKQLRSLLAD